MCVCVYVMDFIADGTLITAAADGAAVVAAANAVLCITCTEVTCA